MMGLKLCESGNSCSSGTTVNSAEHSSLGPSPARRNSDRKGVYFGVFVFFSYFALEISPVPTDTGALLCMGTVRVRMAFLG
jgi:hypothetical protein